MELSQHVLKAIKDCGQSDSDSALLHACLAIEATARNLYGFGGRKAYKDCIRQYLWIVEAMMGYGLNLKETTWGNAKVDDGYGGLVVVNSFEDIIYHIFRCNNAHAKPVTQNYELLPILDNKMHWQIGGGFIRMPENVLWALLAISVFSGKNSSIKTSGNYFLTLGGETFVIKDWWGREDDFKIFLNKRFPNPTKVKIDGLRHLDPTVQKKVFDIEVTPPC